jgi:hypothetical protein
MFAFGRWSLVEASFGNYRRVRSELFDFPWHEPLRSFTGLCALAQSNAMLSVSLSTNVLLLYLTSEITVVRGTSLTASVIAVEAVVALLYSLFAITWHNAVAKVRPILCCVSPVISPQAHCTSSPHWQIKRSLLHRRAKLHALMSIANALSPADRWDVDRCLALFQRKIREQIQNRVKLREADLKEGWKHTATIRSSLHVLIYVVVLGYIGLCAFIVLTFGTTRMFTGFRCWPQVIEGCYCCVCMYVCVQR